MLQLGGLAAGLALAATFGCDDGSPDPDVTHVTPETDVTAAPHADTTARADEPVETDPWRFTDSTDHAGLNMTHDVGVEGDYRFEQIMGAGCALFDFDGDGRAEVIYNDECNFRIYDGVNGDVLFKEPSESRTRIEYPVVADVDNDGSAEIVVASNEGYDDPDPEPAIQVIRDKEDRWIQARRIWNQHTYHVTNVNEDATIPVFEKPNWETFNTFRTNAQIQGGETCIPPEG